VYFVPVLLVLMAYLWRSKIRASHLLVLGAAILAYLVFSGILTHLEDRFFEHEDGSLSHRVEGMHAYVTQSIEEKFFGVGFGSDPCVRCYYQDIGVTFNLVTRGGAVVTLALALLVVRSIAVNGVILASILFLIPLNEKMFFYEAPIWLFLMLASTRLRARPAARSSSMAPAWRFQPQPLPGRQ
jgi:hypothetical protein